MKAFFIDVGFAAVAKTFSTPDEHDRIIAYYARNFKCLRQISRRIETTRLFCRKSARLDEKLWVETELFLFNRDFLIEQLETFTQNLLPYLDALKNNDADTPRKGQAGGN